MPDRSTLVAGFVRTLRRASNASSFALCAAIGVAGCGDPSAGGGTELPIQVRISVESRVQAAEWRLWSVEESPAAARGAAGAYTFVSRGVLRDSAGVLALPNDPGVYLLEAWVKSRPGDSLDVAVASHAGFAIDSSCVQVVPASGEIVRVQQCRGQDMSLLPSADDSIHAPDQLSVLRIEGRTPQRIQLLDDAGTARLLPAEARLWQISTDTADDQILIFGGRLARESDGTFRLPVQHGSTRYVLEAASGAGAMPTHVRTRIAMGSGWTRYLRCEENILPPLPGTISVHDCPDLDWQLSGHDSAHVGAGMWSAFSTHLP